MFRQVFFAALVLTAFVLAMALAAVNVYFKYREMTYGG